MTEQQYRIIADRDKGDDPQDTDWVDGDRVTFIAGGSLVRIERPVPIPTAEPSMCGAISALTNDPCVEDEGHNGRHLSIRGFSWKPLARWEASAEPPRIEDMAPGTTETDDIVWCRNDQPHSPHRRQNRWRDYDYCSGRPVPNIDSSTIRDMTPPKDQE